MEKRCVCVSKSSTFIVFLCGVSIEDSVCVVSVCVCDSVCMSVCDRVLACDGSFALVLVQTGELEAVLFVGLAGNGKLHGNPGNLSLMTMAEVRNILSYFFSTFFSSFLSFSQILLHAPEVEMRKTCIVVALSFPSVC